MMQSDKSTTEDQVEATTRLVKRLIEEQKEQASAVKAPTLEEQLEDRIKTQIKTHTKKTPEGRVEAITDVILTLSSEELMTYITQVDKTFEAEKRRIRHDGDRTLSPLYTHKKEELNLAKQIYEQTTGQAYVAPVRPSQSYDTTFPRIRSRTASGEASIQEEDTKVASAAAPGLK